MSGPFTGSELTGDRKSRAALDRVQRDIDRVRDEDIDVAYPQRLFLRRRSDGARFHLDIAAGPTFTLTDDAGTVTTIGGGSGLPYTDNSVHWGVGAVEIPGVTALTLGDQATQAATTMFLAGNAAGQIGGMEFDLPDGGTGIVPGGAYFGVHLTAANRIPFNVFGTVLGWEFNVVPFAAGKTLWGSSNLNWKALTKTAAYIETATEGEVIAFCNRAGGFPVILPAASGNSAKLTYKNMHAAGPITILAAGSDTIDGNSSIILSSQFAAVTLVPDGASAWGII